MRGNFYSHEKALTSSSLYSGKDIISQVAEAATSALKGYTAYEKDGTIFLTRPPNLKTYKILDRIMHPNSTDADFWGCVGAFFFNALEVFPTKSRKIVIKQASMSIAGRKSQKMSETSIKFPDGSNLDSLPDVDIIAILAVLWHASNSFQALQQWAHAWNLKAIIIDRTALTNLESEWRLRLHPGYYVKDVSYPVQFLSIN